MDIIQDQWSPIHNVCTLLTSIQARLAQQLSQPPRLGTRRVLHVLTRCTQSLLTDPNPASPANPEAAQVYISDRPAFNRCAVTFHEALRRAPHARRVAQARATLRPEVRRAHVTLLVTVRVNSAVRFCPKRHASLLRRSRGCRGAQQHRSPLSGSHARAAWRLAFGGTAARRRAAGTPFEAQASAPASRAAQRRPGHGRRRALAARGGNRRRKCAGLRHTARALLWVLLQCSADALELVHATCTCVPPRAGRCAGCASWALVGRPRVARVHSVRRRLRLVVFVAWLVAHRAQKLPPAHA